MPIQTPATSTQARYLGTKEPVYLLAAHPDGNEWVCASATVTISPVSPPGADAIVAGGTVEIDSTSENDLEHLITYPWDTTTGSPVWTAGFYKFAFHMTDGDGNIDIQEITLSLLAA